MYFHYQHKLKKKKTFDLVINEFIIFSVLKAINEDSPTVPTLLTDYILKGNFKKLKVNNNLYCCNYYKKK